MSYDEDGALFLQATLYVLWNTEGSAVINCGCRQIAVWQCFVWECPLPDCHYFVAKPLKYVFPAVQFGHEKDSTPTHKILFLNPQTPGRGGGGKAEIATQRMMAVKGVQKEVKLLAGPGLFLMCMAITVVAVTRQGNEQSWRVTWWRGWIQRLDEGGNLYTFLPLLLSYSLSFFLVLCSPSYLSVTIALISSIVCFFHCGSSIILPSFHLQQTLPHVMEGVKLRKDL